LDIDVVPFGELDSMSDGLEVLSGESDDVIELLLVGELLKFKLFDILPEDDFDPLVVSDAFCIDSIKLTPVVSASLNTLSIPIDALSTVPVD
tara:strand:- start:265 stop:540 length:276 start_codon:yes stop_codon:yes gene_type:complete